MRMEHFTYATYELCFIAELYMVSSVSYIYIREWSIRTPHVTCYVKIGELRLQRFEKKMKKKK